MLRPIRAPGRYWTWRTALLAVMVMAGLVTVGASGAAAQTPLEQYNYAVGAYRQERWELAADAFAEFVDENPTHPRAELARLYQGLALTNAKDYTAARPVWRKFIETYPKSQYLGDAQYRLAESSYLLDDFKTAEPELQAFLKANPDHKLAEWALPFLGEAQLKLDQPEAAAETFRQAIDEFPKGALVVDAEFGLGRAYEALGKPQFAAEVYRAVAAKTEHELAPQAQLNLATILYDQGEYEDAAAAYESLEQKFPKSQLVPTARLNAGYAYHQAGEYREAIEAFQTAADVPSQAARANYWTGLAHKALGEYEQAAAVFKRTAELAKDDPLLQSVLYQWADTELRAEHFDTARVLFLDVADRWPKSDDADDALHLAGEAALLEARAATDPQVRQQRVEEALAIARRFEKEYPESSTRVRNELLIGRLLDMQGGEANQRAAAERFRKVLDGAASDQTKQLARFHLARTLQQLGQHAKTVEAVEPLLTAVRDEGASSEFLGALVLAANSELALDHNEEAAKLATDYLELAPQGDEAELALAARAVARAGLGQTDAARADLAALRERAPDGRLAADKTLQVAEAAYDREDWEFAAEMFETLVKAGPETPNYAAALSGLAWTRFEQGRFADAATDFGQYLREFGDDPARGPEAAYMRAQSLEKADKLSEAAETYETAFARYAPKEPAAADAETTRPLRFAFLSGLLAARALDRLGKVEEADAAYEALLMRFPEAAELDKLLDEWALMNLQAERYEQSDAIFRRLVKERPESDLADNARLSLAESDFVAGKLDAARKTFEELAAAEKSDAEVRERALFQLVELSAEQEDWKTVADAAGKLRQQFPESAYRFTATFRTAEALMAQGKTDEAQALLKELLAQKDEPAVAEARWLPRVWVLLAETYLRQKEYGKVQETVAAFEAALPKSDRLYEAYEVLGRAYKNQAQWEKAREAFEKVVTAPSSRGTETRAKAQLMIAETYWHQEEYTKAQEGYLKVYLLHNFPEWQAPALYQAGLCDEKLQRWDQAAKTYREVQSKFPQSEYAAKAAERLDAIRPKAAG